VKVPPPGLQQFWQTGYASSCHRHVDGLLGFAAKETAFSSTSRQFAIVSTLILIVAWIPLISHYYVPKRRQQTESAEWAGRLRKIALDKLQPKAKSLTVSKNPPSAPV
jgi:hypothetical protein